MMSTVLRVSNSRALSKYTPLFAGMLVATFIAFESPLSGMSMNPARTVASAAIASDCTAIWVYFAAPIPAMALAALVTACSQAEIASSAPSLTTTTTSSAFLTAATEKCRMTTNGHYDVIIIDTGAGGGTLAWKLAPPAKTSC